MNETQTKEPIKWASYVAMGDSFTEGLSDPYPDGTMCGWADRLASSLSARRIDSGQDPLQYANLAIRGRKIKRILAEQIPIVLQVKPDLVSLVAGGNDILRPKADVDLLAHMLDTAVGALRNQGSDVLLVTSSDCKGSPIIENLRGRVGVFNSHIWSIARNHNAYVVNQWGMPFLRSWDAWAADRIHLTPVAHHKFANGALVALGLTPDDPNWNNPISENPIQVRGMDDLLWAKNHALPWVGRHLRGRSSGDGRHPKYPQLQAFYPLPGSATQPA